MAVHRINVPYDVDDQDALEGAIRELDKAGQRVNFVQYFCVAPQSTFLLQTNGGRDVKLGDASKLAGTPAKPPAAPAAKAKTEAAKPAAKQRVERRTRS